MYVLESFDPTAFGESKMRGPGVKSAERQAIESLSPGQMVRIPKSAAKRGSMGAWAFAVGKEKDCKVCVTSSGGDWIVYIPAQS